MIPFPVKVLKLLISELQSDNDAAALTGQGLNNLDAVSDDGASNLEWNWLYIFHFWQDEDWADEENLIQGFKPDEFALLSEMLGSKGTQFEEEGVTEQDLEDFEELPVGNIDMKVGFLLCTWWDRYWT